ncbi:MAG: hypothetical protein ACI39G_00015 [Pseudoramibacter sp.]
MTKVNIRHFQSLGQIKRRRQSQQQAKKAEAPEEPAHPKENPAQEPASKQEKPDFDDQAKPLSHQQKVYREMVRRAEAIRHKRREEQKKQQQKDPRK